MHFPAKGNSGRIAIQWFHIKHYLDNQAVYLSCAKNVFLHVPRLLVAKKYKFMLFSNSLSILIVVN